MTDVINNLKTAIELGGEEYRMKAKQEEDFQPLCKDDEFKKLIGK